MEKQLSEDLSLFTSQKAQFVSLLDAVRSQVGTSFGDMQQLQIRNDKAIISVGGQTVEAGQQFQIRLAEDMCIHNLRTLSLCGQLQLFVTGADDAARAQIKNNTFTWNLAQLFRANYMKVGSVQYSYAESQTYQQLNLEQMPPDFVQSIAKQMLMKVDSTTSADVVQSILQDYNQISKVPCTQIPAGGNNAWISIPFVVPLYVIFPALLQFEDCSVYTNAGSVVEFSIYTQPFAECFARVNSGNPYASNYRIENISVVHQYTRLSSELDSVVQRSEFVFNPIQLQNLTVSPLTSTPQVQFSVSAGQKMKRLLFGFAKRQSGDQSVAITNMASYGNANVNLLSSSACFLPIPIRQIVIYAGSDKLVIPSDQISNVMQLIQPSQSANTRGGQLCGFRNDQSQYLRTAYSIDLSRFAFDPVGSTAKSQIQVIVQIYFDLNASPILLATETLLGTGTGQQMTDLLPSLTMFAYLEVLDQLLLSAGRYKSV